MNGDKEKSRIVRDIFGQLIDLKAYFDSEFNKGRENQMLERALDIRQILDRDIGDIWEFLLPPELKKEFEKQVSVLE